MNAPVHPDKGELLVRVKAPGEAMEDASLVEALGPAGILPLQQDQPFKAIVLVLTLKIGHLGSEDDEIFTNTDESITSLSCLLVSKVKGPCLIP